MLCCILEISWENRSKIVTMWGDRCVNTLAAVITSQCICILSHHVVHLKKSCCTREIYIVFICQSCLKKAGKEIPKKILIVKKFRKTIKCQ